MTKAGARLTRVLTPEQRMDWLLRINDSLPRTGWRIRDDYRIERISAEHENRLILRLGVAA